MTLPTTSLTFLLVAIFGLICGAAWANTIKLGGKRRFELYYFDFAIGFMLTAGIVALTLGTLGTDGFVLTDDFMHAGYRNIAYGIAAGIVFNLGNMLLVAGIKMAGMSVAFPASVGLGFAVWNVLAQVIDGQGKPGLIFAGLAVLVVAIVFDMWAYGAHAFHQELEKMKAGEHRTLRPSVSWKGIVVSIIGGILMGSTQPLVQMSRSTEIGLGPYALGLAFCLGAFFSTFVFSLYFMNLPLAGKPLEMRDYFRSQATKARLLALVGGAVWALGIIAGLVITAPIEGAQVNPVVLSWARGGIAPLGALFGVFVWREFSGAGAKTKTLVFVMFILLLAGLGLIAAAQVAA